VQRDLDKTEEESNRNLMYFGQDKAKQYPWAGSTAARTQTGDCLAGSSSSGRDLGALANISAA